MKTSYRKTVIRGDNLQWSVPLICFLVLVGVEQALARAPGAASGLRYQIEVDLDYGNATMTGRETVHFTNSSREELESVVFHLYPNVGLSEEDEAWLTVQRVSLAGRDLKFSTRARQMMLKVELPAKLGPGQSIDLALEFMARIPRVQREEASLLAHFLQEVNDAVGDDRQTRDSRDIFFAGDEAILLGYFYPMIAPRQLQLGEQGLASGVNGIVFSEVADYEVVLRTEGDLTVLASAACVNSGPAAANRRTHVFRGENLRGFTIVLAERVKSVEKRVGSVRVVSYYRESDERLGKKALQIAVGALETYIKAFGDYPYPLLQIVELPLPAGYSGIDFPSVVAQAQAYYIDFDAPHTVRLPNILREQSDVIKSSFEFSIAQGVAHQWWGEAVGSDPERSPYLAGALATYAAAYYHEAVYGRQLGETIIEQHLNGAYQAYRMLGGPDTEVEKPIKEFKNSLQYTAIVEAKGALLFAALRKELGDEKFFNALRYYFASHRFHIALPEHLRFAFLAAAEDPNGVRTLFQRWLKEKHGDEDIGTPDLTLLPTPVSKMRALGRVFIKIGRTAAKQF